MANANTDQSPVVNPAEQHQNFILEHAFTREQMWQMLGKSARSWHRMERAGLTPPFIRVGRDKYYLKQTALRWFQSLEQQPRSRRRPARRAPR